MKKIFIVLALIISAAAQAQTYYCPISSMEGATKKFDQWFIVQDDAVFIKTSSDGKIDSLHYKKIASTNPAVVYFTDGTITSSLTIVHSPGAMKGTKYTDVVSFKPDLKAEQPVGLWYCTINSGHP